MRNFITILSLIPSLILAQGIDNTKKDTLSPVIINRVAILSSVQVNASKPSIKIVDNVELKKKDIQLNTEIPLALQNLPSINSTSDAGSGFGYTFLRVRGMDQTRLAVTLNGMPIADPEDQGFYSSNIPNFISSMESISLNRGVTGSSGGVAGLAGQLDFISKNPLTTSIAKADGTFTIGSYNTKQLNIKMNSGTKGSTSGWLDATAQRSDGYRIGSRESGTSFIGSATHIINERNQVTVFSALGNVQHGSAWFPIPLSEVRSNPRANLLDGLGENFQQGIFQLQTNHILSNSDKLSLTLMENTVIGTFDVPNTPTLAADLSQRWWQGAITWEHNIFNSGILISNDNRQHSMSVKDSDRLYSNVGHKNEATVWSRMMGNIFSIEVIPELQLRNINFTYNPSISGGTFEPKNWTFLNPKLTLNKSIGTFNISTSVAKTDREPTRSDLFGGADDLDPVIASEINMSKVLPEQMKSIEFTVSRKTTNTSWMINLFSMNFRNEISPSGPLNSMGLPFRRNVPLSYRRGIEASINQSITPTIDVNLVGSVIDAKIAIWNDSSTGEYARNTRSLQTPSYIFHTTINKKITKKTYIEMTNNFRGEMFLSNIEDSNNRLGPTTWTDVKLHSKGLLVETTISVQNITNSLIFTGGWAGTEPLVYVMGGRNINVQFKIPLMR